jgi:PAS domain S-box-containing protein
LIEAPPDDAAGWHGTTPWDERLRFAQLASASGIWEIDLTSDTVTGTRQFFLIMGIEPTDQPVPMARLRELRLPEDRDSVNRDFAAALGSGRDFLESEFRIRRADGQVRWIFGRGRVIRDGQGRPVRYSGIDIDITERKEAELALADSEARLRLAVAAGNIGIWDWNVLTNEMSWSEEAKAIYGFPPLLPVTFAQVSRATHPEDLPRTSKMGRDALNPAVRSNDIYEYRIIRPDGEVRWILARGEATFAVVDGAERGVRYTGTIQDITERKRAENRLRKSEKRLRLAGATTRATRSASAPRARPPWRAATDISRPNTGSCGRMARCAGTWFAPRSRWTRRAGRPAPSGCCSTSPSARRRRNTASF